MTTSLAHPTTEVATRWQIDAAHSNIEFGVRHLMISNVKGRFGDVAGLVTVDPDDPRAVISGRYAPDREHRHPPGTA